MAFNEGKCQCANLNYVMYTEKGAKKTKRTEIQLKCEEAKKLKMQITREWRIAWATDSS